MTLRRQAFPRWFRPGDHKVGDRFPFLWSMEEHPVGQPPARPSPPPGHRCQAAACRSTEVLSQDVWLCSEHDEEFLTALEHHVRLTP